MKILISAHEFSPYQGSECAVGWNLINNISKQHEVTVVFAKTNQFNTNSYYADILKYIDLHGPIPNVNLIPIPQPFLSKIFIFINKYFGKDKSSIGIPVLYFIAYNFWQRSVYKFVLNNIDFSKIDVIHHLTSISFREPGYLWKIDKPFFWGPISGNVKIPDGFFCLLTDNQKLFQKLRNYLLDYQLHNSKRISDASIKASKIYCVTYEDYFHFQKNQQGKVSYMLDVGCSNQSFLKRKNETKTIKFLWVGRIVYSKALPILLYCISRLQKEILFAKVEYTIIGDGPELEKNMAIANDLNLKNIKWLGKIKHDEVKYLLSQADCLVHTSIREATSATILEALSASIPVICHDAFGMAFAINNKCGIKVPFVDLETSISGFYSAMLKIINDTNYLKWLSQNANKRSKELSWETMGRTIAKDYTQLKNLV